MIKARSEEAASRASFRSAMRQRRCLIPADGFYEWEKVGTAKQPHWFRLANEQPFAFAGLSEQWSN
jgi:putative SOS response-associated peptidase YedK